MSMWDESAWTAGVSYNSDDSLQSLQYGCLVGNCLSFRYIQNCIFQFEKQTPETQTIEDDICDGVLKVHAKAGRKRIVRLIAPIEHRRKSRLSPLGIGRINSTTSSSNKPLKYLPFQRRLYMLSRNAIVAVWLGAMSNTKLTERRLGEYSTNNPVATVSPTISCVTRFDHLPLLHPFHLSRTTEQAGENDSISTFHQFYPPNTPVQNKHLWLCCHESV